MKHHLTPKYWEDRYLNDDFGWDLGQISPPIKEYSDQLTNKELFILIPGAGNSYEAEYLVNKGFTNVYVCDITTVPLQNLLKRCPKIDPSHLLLVDFFEMNNNTETSKVLKFDIIIEQTFFCAINKSLRAKYFQKAHELLNPKGKIVGLLFNDTLNEDKPPFGGTAQEYQEYFKLLFKPKVYEMAHNSIKPRAGRELFINLEKI